MILLTANHLTSNSYTTHETLFELQLDSNVSQYTYIFVFTCGVTKRG